MVLDQAENGVLDNDHDMAATNEPPQADVKPLEAHATEEGKKPGVDVPKATSAETSKAPATNVPTAASTAAIPQALLSSGMSSINSLLRGKELTVRAVQDENLKNIMMSWYYAGYYTGLYEGQQKASAALQPDG